MMAFPIVIIMPVLLAIGLLGSFFGGLFYSGGNPLSAIYTLIGFIQNII